MIDTIFSILRAHPELALFLALGIGYAIGKITIAGVTIGAVTGCLLAGVLIGQTGAVLSNDVKQAFFLLFLFAIGYRTGPQFFQSLNADALPQIAVTVTLCVVALGVAIVLSIFFGFDLGTAAGVLAGGATESATVGVAIDTFRKTAPTPEAANQFESAVATGFAVAYLVGVVSAILVQSQLAPRMFGRSLKDACAELEAELNITPHDAGNSARREIEARAFAIADNLVGLTVEEAEARVPEKQKAYIEQIRRGSEIITPKPKERLQAGDVIAVAGLRGFLVEYASRIGTEIDDRELLDIPVEILDVVVTNKEVAGKRLWQLNQQPEARSVFLRGILRAGQPIPIFPGLTVRRGDVMSIAGARRHVEDAAALLGYADRETTATDMVFVGVFIFLGGLIGIPALKLGALEIGLGVAVGVLIAGLVAGWLRSVRRTFGFVPEATLWFFDSVGLCAFIACVGISAGPSFVAGLVQSGPALVIASALICVISHVAALALGRFVFRMNEGVLAGTCCGAGTSAPALAAVQEAAGSKVPTLGYGLGYAIGNVLLALWGAVLVTVLG
ncbi:MULTISPECIES: TrkA C-terminal domain-containing protein [unclassified Ensifer]|uniref:aspartate:alanine exchanger family transporter n=1 Tax=unclassified Ensifer TaxID=2633371 RepID=UPI0009F1F049|nr:MULTISPECIES: TrkA C-terminal domain-containing protein [unclassified Ensifer]